MARMRSIPSEELAPDLATICEEFAGAYGPFRNQVAVIAHVPAALRHHTPFLTAEGLSAAAVERRLEPDNPELDATDRLVIDFARVAWETPNRVPAKLFTALRAVFSEAQIVELTLRITLCGFFNRFNDALGIEDEEEALA
ncbi:MAG: hypothetical protein EBX37_11580 [Alphaproteobacteria bacterium]|nr:hypothetical protein [Alphaproteobacteria bacterium]